MSLRSPLLVLLGLTLGVALSSALRWDAPSQQVAAPARPEAVQPVSSLELEELRADLANERARRSELEEEIEALEARVDPAQRTGQGSAAFDSRDAESDPENQAAWAPPPLRDVEVDKGERFDTRVLERLGFPPREIERIRGRWDAYTMERLAAVDEAERGLRDSTNFSGMLRTLREDLGDNGYDTMLYATGQSNRVRVSRVLDASPAAQAGLREGDVVLSYDGVPVFKPMILRRLTREGRRGEIVDITVRREDGVVDRLFIERGSMGASTVAALEAPHPEL